jgi:hypothetical protein
MGIRVLKTRRDGKRKVRGNRCHIVSTTCQIENELTANEDTSATDEISLSPTPHHS